MSQTLTFKPALEAGQQGKNKGYKKRRLERTTRRLAVAHNRLSKRESLSRVKRREKYQSKHYSIYSITKAATPHERQRANLAEEGQNPGNRARQIKRHLILSDKVSPSTTPRTRVLGDTM